MLPFLLRRRNARPVAAFDRSASDETDDILDLGHDRSRDDTRPGRTIGQNAVDLGRIMHKLCGLRANAADLLGRDFGERLFECRELLAAEILENAPPSADR